jgi:predicted nucleic acid-binding protein
MAVYYFDTSALVKRYAREVGSGWVVQIADPANQHQIYTSRVTSVEVIAALSQKVGRNELVLADAQQAVAAFLYDWQQHDYEVVEVSEAVAAEAMRLAQQHIMRGFDALQLASAVYIAKARIARQLSPLTFVSADRIQRERARHEGLSIEDPNAHP